MTKEEREKAIDLLDNLIGMVEDNQDNDYDKALKMGIESLREEHCEDCVSRAEVASIINKQRFGIQKISMGIIKEKLENLPPVTPAVCIAKVTFNKDDLHELVKEKIKEITVEQEQRWIPVKERLPEESLNSVIGWDAYRERCVFVQYIDGHFQITGRNESFNITAWMPLPEPYKEMESE